MQILILAAIAFIAGTILLFPKKASGSIPPGSAGTSTGGLDDLIRAKANFHSIPFAILKALVWRESDFNPKAWNDERKKGDDSDDAVGLMQVRYGALTDYNNAHNSTYEMADLYDAAINLEVGAWYLGGLIERNGLQPGIEMYNTGEYGYLHRGVRNDKYLSAIIQRSQNYA